MCRPDYCVPITENANACSPRIVRGHEALQLHIYILNKWIYTDDQVLSSQ